MAAPSKKIGLFFGSFNPVHIGHMIIANYMVTRAGLDEVWIVVSPQNPLKDKRSLANDHDRLHLVNLAIGENTRIKVSNIEFQLPRPSYTIDTLTYLEERYPQHQFILLMGGDSLATLEKWKNHEKIVEHTIYVYKRPGISGGIYENHANVHYMDAPMLDISATYIRDCLKNGYSVEYLVPDRVFEYLTNNKLYR